MSLNYNALSSLTRDKFIPVLVDNIFNSNVLAFRLLKNAEKLDGGKKIITPLEYGKNTAQGYYSGYDVLDTTPSDPITSAEWDWCLAYSTISVSGEDELKNAGDSQVLSLLKSKMRNAEKSLKDMFGESLFNGDGATVPATGEITALGGTKLKTSGAFYESGVDNCIVGFGRSLGGIDSTTYAWFDANADHFQDGGAVPSTWIQHLTVPSNGGVSAIISDMTKMYGSCTIDNDSPDLIVTTQVLMDAYESSLMSNKRFEGASDLADAGFQTLRFKGATVVVDSHVPAGQMYFLNTKYLDFKVHSKRNFAFEDFQKPVNQDSRVAKIFWMGQLTCTNPRMQGVLVNGNEDYS
tara:strand:- start:12915 stop:13967 length:1053 start_codon:yes stop_codon:yes gene_type:complete